MRKPLIIANWKSNPLTLKEAVVLARSAEKYSKIFRGADVVVAPPFLFISAVSKILRQAKLGAQDVFWAEGPYTGEISLRQLKNLGVRYVIVGHSSLRMTLGETDEMVNKKIKKNSLKGVKKSQLERVVVAYEPVWAISTMPGAQVDTPQSAVRALRYLRGILSRMYGKKYADKVKMLYGGSVSAKNARQFLILPGVDGALVGGASLRPQEFGEIISQASAF